MKKKKKKKKHKKKKKKKKKKKLPFTQLIPTLVGFGRWCPRAPGVAKEPAAVRAAVGD
jgi:hypothetical protein